MAKYFGKIGYEVLEKTAPGVHTPTIKEREYSGDLTRNTVRQESANQVNANVNIANTISIVADPFAYENFHAMRYAEFMGTKWRITNVEVQYPRLLLTVGGVYNGR